MTESGIWVKVVDIQITKVEMDVGWMDSSKIVAQKLSAMAVSRSLDKQSQDQSEIKCSK